MTLNELVAEFAATLWRVAAQARELEANMPADLELPALEAQLVAIVAFLQ